MDNRSPVLTNARDAWGTPRFGAALKQDIERLNPDLLPLQEALSASSVALTDKLEARIIEASERDGVIRVRAGIFYSGVVAGCSCADDPTPIETQNEYCEVQLDIDRATAMTTVTLLQT